MENNKSGMIIVEGNNIHDIYPKLGSGSEGTIYNYNNKYALKVFDDYYNDERHPKPSKRRFLKKIKKIEELMKIEDPSFCFPIGYVMDYNLDIMGYYMDLLAEDDRLIYDFFKLKDEYKQSSDKTDIFKKVLEADQAIKRIHEKDVYLGDIYEENILIDSNGNPRFVDTDNYIYKNHGYNVTPWRSKIFRNAYKRKVSNKDNDIFLYSTLVMEFLTGREPMYQSVNIQNYFERLLRDIDVDKETKEGLEYIFSDASNKPYISDVLEDFNPNEKVYQKYI